MMVAKVPAARMSLEEAWLHVCSCSICSDDLLPRRLPLTGSESVEVRDDGKISIHSRWLLKQRYAGM